MNKLAFARYKSVSKGRLLNMITPDTWFCLADLESPVSPDSFRVRVAAMDCFEQKQEGRIILYKISAADRALHIDLYYSRVNQDKPIKQKIVAYKLTKEDKLLNLMMRA